jgi:hypothetical protein
MNPNRDKVVMDESHYLILWIRHGIHLAAPASGRSVVELHEHALAARLGFFQGRLDLGFP